jgi:hypothetical protein
LWLTAWDVTWWSLSWISSIEEREQAEKLVKKISDLLDAHNVRVLDYKLTSYIVPFKEVWRFVAMVAVNHSQ